MEKNGSLHWLLGPVGGAHSAVSWFFHNGIHGGRKFLPLTVSVLLAKIMECRLERRETNIEICVLKHLVLAFLHTFDIHAELAC